MSSNNDKPKFVVPNEYIRLMLKERGHSNSFTGVTNVVMRIGALEPTFDHNRARSNIAAAKGVNRFMKRSKTVYRTCPSCGAVESPDIVQLFYCRKCGKSFPDPKAVGGYEEDIMDTLFRVFNKYGFGIGIVQITAIGDSYEVAIDNTGRGQLHDDLDKHNELFTRPAIKAAQEVGETTDYILADTRPVLKEGYPGGVQKFIYWFKRKGT